MLPGAMVGQIPVLVGSHPTQPLTHILELELEFLLEVVDSGRARFNVLAQGGAAGDDAAEASGGCQCPSVPPVPAPRAPWHGTHRS